MSTMATTETSESRTVSSNTASALSEELRLHPEFADDANWKAKQITARFRESERRKSSMVESRWRKNHNFLFGNQWTQYNPQTKRMEQSKVAKARRVTRNLLLKRIGSAVAYETNNKPVLRCLPNGYDQTSLEQAKCGEKVLRWLWQECHMSEKRIVAAWMKFITGIAFLKYWYNSEAGKVIVEEEPVIDEMTGEQVKDPQTGEPQFTGRILSAEYEGTIEVELCSAYEMHVPPNLPGPDLSSCPWVIHAVPRTTKWVMDNYGVEVQPEAIQKYQTARVNTFYTTEAGELEIDSGQEMSSGSENMVMVLEYYERPSIVPGFERGKKIVVAEDKVLEEENSQLSTGDYPFVYFVETIKPGQFWPHTILSEMTEAQYDINVVWSRLKQYQAKCFLPNVVHTKGDGIPDDAFTSFGGKNIQKNMGFENPIYMVPPPVPEGLFASIQAEQATLDEIQGQHGFARGNIAKGDPSGTAVQLVQEADATDMGPTIQLNSIQLGKLGKDLLDLVHRNYKTQRLMQIQGPGDLPEIYHFLNSHIAPMNTVTVQEGSGIPLIQTAKKQEIIQFMSMGLFGNPGDPNIRAFILELLQYPPAFEYADLTTKDRRFATFENMLMFDQGQEIHINEHDDDMVHIDVHSGRCKDLSWFTLPPKIKEIALAHIQEHVMRMQTAQMEQMNQQANMQARMSLAAGMGNIVRGITDTAREQAKMRQESQMQLMQGGQNNAADKGR